LKSLFITIAIGVAAAALYIASPFVSAWSIREAVRNGNAGYLASAVEWSSVRETLKPSIARMALNLPDPEQDPAASKALWPRIKTYWGQSAVDRIVDIYVTPERLPQLFTLGKAYRDYASRGSNESEPEPLMERIARAWSRVKRAEFTGLTTFEIDVVDKHDASRTYLGKFKLTPAGWKLAELRVAFHAPATDAAGSAQGGQQNALQ
jgi:hypothetical protein